MNMFFGVGLIGFILAVVGQAVFATRTDPLLYENWERNGNVGMVLTGVGVLFLVAAVGIVLIGGV